MINGRSFDWESIRIDTPWGINIDVQNIDYDTEMPLEMNYGRGNIPRGYGQGNLVQTGNLSVDGQAFLAVSAFAALHGGLFRIPPFGISVSYNNVDQTIQTDFLPSAKFTKVTNAAAQGDTLVNVKVLDFAIMDPVQLNLVAVG